MILLIYCLIIFASTIIGALVGMGGGIIIKPALDLLNVHSVEVVGFISTCAVFAMSISSSIKHIRQKTKIEPKIVLLISFGSIIGGVIGNSIFDLLFNKFNSNKVKIIQAIIICLLLIFVVIYVNFDLKRFKIQNSFAIITAGLLLGLLSAFLGIGGGPINTALLVLLFSFTVKESAVYSVAIIFFSQLSQLIAIFINNQFEPYIKYYPYIISAMVISVIGGIIGSKLNKKLSEKAVKNVFTITLLVVILINISNIFLGVKA